MLVIGPAVGNYACSVVYRLPRRQTPFERHPFCGHCSTDLKPIDLFPIWSWVMMRGKCRYCGGVIPSIYTAIEMACGLTFIVYFLWFGLSELFLLYAAFATFVVILASIQWQQGWLSSSIYVYALTFVALARTLSEHTIYGFVQSGFLMLMLALMVSRLSPVHRNISPFERPWIWWWVLLGSIVPVNEWNWIFLPLLLVHIMPRHWQSMLYAACALLLPITQL